MKGIVVQALLFTSSVMAGWPEAKGKLIKYSSVPGYFLQDDPNTDASKFDYAEHNLGLIDREYPTDKKFDPNGSKPQWQRFGHWLSYLNSKCNKDDNTKFKLVVFGRHGQGYHNVAESFYGTPAWNCYWAEKTGNGTISWEDPLLTDAGEAEAAKANAFFKSRYESHGMPYFEVYYNSPLKRCIQTSNITFGSLDLPETHRFEPIIKEYFRESISIHTCDHRSTKSEIRAFAPPNYRFEDGFSEEDRLWHKTEGETSAGQAARNKIVLDDVFTHDDSTWISVTAHSGEIASLLSVLNHRKFGLSTGQVIPVLVKAELVDPPTTTSPVVSFTSEATCNEPPVTSISGQGCVCSPTATPQLNN